MKNAVSSVPYLSNLDEECKYHVIFSLSTREYPKNQIFQKPKDAADSMYFL